MDKVINLHASFHAELLRDDIARELLNQKNIAVLNGFNRNIELVRRYYQTVYSQEAKRVVLCGINPGKNGAGKTGIPFIDFRSASRLLSDVEQLDQERSSQFIYSVIEEVGVKFFYENVYMTNLSWFGFTTDGINLNYYDLPPPLSTVFTNSFIEEMNLVQPKVIVPLSEVVEKDLKLMKKDGKLPYSIAPRLAHPFYCSIGNRKNKYRMLYAESIKNLIKNY